MKKIDVLVEDGPVGITVWADKGKENVIRGIPGITWVGSSGTEYRVHLDPRYDVEWIKEEIIARIKIGD